MESGSSSSGFRAGPTPAGRVDESEFLNTTLLLVLHP